MLLRGCQRAPRELHGLIPGRNGTGLLHTLLTRRLPPLLPSAGDTPTNKGNPQANLSVYAHAPKTHTNTKQQGGISVHVSYFEYVYRLLCGGG